MGQGQGPFQLVLAPPYLESSRRQILITWQSHPRRPRGSSHFQDQHPKQLCSCLTGQVSHLELKNKPQILQQTFLKPHELCPAPSRPWRSCSYGKSGRRLFLPRLWHLFSPLVHQTTQPQAAPHFFHIWGDFSTFTMEQNFSCNAIFVTIT